jgi:glyoxylase-like metal-dependent hydrolase (beta-lactamase superfamily II)
VNELRPGLWTWTAPHPSWTPDQGGPEGWDEKVRSYAFDAGDSLVLFDPLVDASEVETLADGRPVVVILTCYWHRRSTAELVESLGAVVHAPATGMGELGLTAKPYELGDDLPGDVEPQPGAYPTECTLWIRGHSALVSGDAFLGGGERAFGLQPESWLDEGTTSTDLRERLQPLLELPVELLLPTHGDPVEADAAETLRRALET